MAVHSEIVRLLGLGNSSVLNGAGGTVADAGHTVSTMISPDGLLVFHGNIIQRTKLFTFSAANTCVGRMEVFGREHEAAPDWIEWHSDDRLEEPDVSGG